MQHNPECDMTSKNYPRCGDVFQEVRTPAMRQLFLRMLHPNPVERLSVHHVLNNFWFEERVECCHPTEPGELRRMHEHFQPSKFNLLRLRLPELEVW